MLNYVDKLPPMKGHWVVDVYEGDVERRPLTAEQERENALWKELSGSPLPLHVGEIVSKPIDSFEGDNIIVTTGKSLMLDRLFGIGTPSALTSMGVGASATTAAVGDTALLTTPTIQNLDATATRSGLVVTAVSTFATGTANINWQELGLFNGNVNGTSTMFNRIAPIGPFNKTSAVSLVPSITITQA